MIKVKHIKRIIYHWLLLHVWQWLVCSWLHRRYRCYPQVGPPPDDPNVWHCKKCFRLKPKSLTTSTKVKNGGKTKTTRLRKRKMYTTSSTSTTTTLPYTLPYTYMKYEITFWERIMRFFGF